MMHGLFIGATGLKTHGEGMQVISNNIANVNTVGYKQQQWLFQDLMYQQQTTGSLGQGVVDSKIGLGSTINDIRTLFTEGPFEPASGMTDLAITGKGFFQVTDDQGRNFFTRAGNFRFREDGVLRDPSGNAVTGIPIDRNGKEGPLSEVKLDFNDSVVATDPPKATEQMLALMNVNIERDIHTDAANPYFSLLSNWNGKRDPSIAAGHSQPMTVYDAGGNKHTVAVHFDQAPAPAGGNKVLEYVVTIPPAEDGRPGAEGTEGAGLLMSGTLTFSPAGELINMSAYTPGTGDLKDLNNWHPAEIKDGSPVLNMTFKGQPAQAVAFNVGVSGGSWNQGGGSAASVGTNYAALPGMSSPIYHSNRTTAYPKSSALASYNQDGYPMGDISDMHVTDSGLVVAQYSNGQSHELYRIPVFNFTSEDGLRREGNNLYSATPDAGEFTHGVAGTENYGAIQGNALEQSNVDMSKEMTSMIIMQRGFQSNSKSVTTYDSMIQKAIELKR